MIAAMEKVSAFGNICVEFRAIKIVKSTETVMVSATLGISVIIEIANGECGQYASVSAMSDQDECWNRSKIVQVINNVKDANFQVGLSENPVSGVRNTYINQTLQCIGSLDTVVSQAASASPRGSFLS